MNDKIDIVVTYLNDSDKVWRENYDYWKQYEISHNITPASSIQAFGEERSRNWGIMKYWFRAVEQNCSWINKIFFVVQNERHIPEWLDVTNSKLRIVYHEEFIPKELLPTFNGMTIGLYINQIQDLSDNYIMCDDDYFFLNPVEETKFFVNNVVQYENNQIPYGYFYDWDEFLHILNNNFDFEKKYMNGKEIKYSFCHLPIARKKSIEQKILKDNYLIFLKAQKPSKFRYKTNLDANLYPNVLKLSGQADILPEKSIYGNSLYVPLKDNYNFYLCDKLDMVCFNDTNLVTKNNFEKIKQDLTDFLQYKFPNKSSFEK